MSDLFLSKKGERIVTPFVGQELLYDYIRGELDPERVQALEKLLNENRDLKSELEKIREGLNYVIDLQQTQVSAALTDSIRVPSTYLHQLLQKAKFSDWPEGVKLAFEGLVVGLGALTLILLIPWSRLLSWKTELEKTSIVLTEVNKTVSLDPDGEMGATVENPPNPIFEDETKPVETSSKVAKAPVKVEAPAATAPAAPVKPSAPTEAPTAESAMASAPPDAGKRQGFLYRGTVSVTNLEMVNPKLVEFIKSSGGRKAGEVELGWKKGDGTYFHFTIPEAKYKALTDLFQEYGTLRINKEPHPRVMPDGIIRLIITVDEKK